MNKLSAVQTAQCLSTLYFVMWLTVFGVRITSINNCVSEFSPMLKWDNVTFHVQPLSWWMLSQLKCRKWSRPKLDSCNTCIKISYNFDKNIAQSWHWLDLYGINTDFLWVFSNKLESFSKFPDILPQQIFPWHISKFSDNSLTSKKLNFPWSVPTL